MVSINRKAAAAAGLVGILIWGGAKAAIIGTAFGPAPEEASSSPASIQSEGNSAAPAAASVRPVEAEQPSGTSKAEAPQSSVAPGADSGAPGKAAPQAKPASSPIPASVVAAAEQGPAHWAYLSNRISFPYFLQSGYFVRNPAILPCLGKVKDSPDGLESYSTPQKVYVELASDAKAAPGDLWAVYNSQEKVQEPRASFTAWRVRPLAVVRVLDVQKRKCLVQVKSDYFPFHDNDLVMPYEEQLRRWEWARLRKVLPEKEIRGFVGAGSPGKEGLNRMDTIVLTVGSRNGVVEGQTFQLREKEGAHSTLRGEARVFYAGTDYSMAQITTNSQPIFPGFEAWYQP